MAQRQLNIRSDEAAQIAATLARRLGKTATDVVVEALRAYQSATGLEGEGGLTAEQRQSYDSLRALARQTASHAPAGMTSDHDWLYDENGLPR